MPVRVPGDKVYVQKVAQGDVFVVLPRETLFDVASETFQANQEDFCFPQGMSRSDKVDLVKYIAKEYPGRFVKVNLDPLRYVEGCDVDTLATS